MSFDVDRFVRGLEIRRDSHRSRHVLWPSLHLDVRATEIDVVLDQIKNGKFDIEVWEPECEKT